MRHDNRGKDEDICASMRKQVRKRNELEMEKASIENKDKMREAQLQSEMILENMKKEVK